jgi:drug/metabolite transporter (DMT)-like permease
MRTLEAKSKGQITEFNKLWLAIPALSDFITSTLQYVALNFISGSVYQMTRGGAIVTTFIFSIFFLKIKVVKNQILGAALALVGVLIVGISNIAFADPDDGGTDPVPF